MTWYRPFEDIRQNVFGKMTQILGVRIDSLSTGFAIRV
jgi:hypothetical protein